MRSAAKDWRGEMGELSAASCGELQDEEEQSSSEEAAAREGEGGAKGGVITFGEETLRRTNDEEGKGDCWGNCWLARGVLPPNCCRFGRRGVDDWRRGVEDEPRARGETKTGA